MGRDEQLHLEPSQDLRNVSLLEQRVLILTRFSKIIYVPLLGLL